MTKHDKTRQKLLVKPTPSDITWDELKSFLKQLGYNELTGDGSRRKFVHNGKKDVISIHKPHPQPQIKTYAVKMVVEHLKQHGHLN